MDNEITKISLVHRSETRRKACNGCCDAKRRCDLILPSCGRCMTKRMKCVYVCQNLHITEAEADNMSVRRASNERLTTCNGLHFSLKLLQPGYLTKQQMNYMVAQFRGFIKSIVSEGETPFIHRLYQDTMPDIYQDALSICSLYVQKTPRNQGAIFRMLDSKLDTLLRISDSARVEDNLLSLQCLILYQIIRLLDGDAQQRINAERHLELLDLWTLRLQQNYFQAISSTRVGYDNWVLIESIRRTTMVSVILRASYFAMRDGYCELVDLLSTLSVSTRSSRVWKMEDEWEEGKSTSEVLTYAEFTNEWNKGRVDGIEEYEKLLLVACRYAKVAGKFDPSA
ncbi:Transcription factor gsfR2 [Hyphodiscus hymeniophilus]|uniref:Transcription factor gsfR2 n=1 Tax=Hyphodiscus hymeniophilus TaxID=353542 RepID=A0A9P6SNS6_9HELO|nr:Transcription factor gsfR2 [Hyphodiscus hymeniophilus]